MRPKDRSVLILLIRGVLIIPFVTYIFTTYRIIFDKQSLAIEETDYYDFGFRLELSLLSSTIWIISILVIWYINNNHTKWRYKIEYKFEKRDNQGRIETDNERKIGVVQSEKEKLTNITPDWSLLTGLSPYPKKKAKGLQFEEFETDTFQLLTWYQNRQMLNEDNYEKGDLIPYIIKYRQWEYNMEEFFYSYRIAMRNCISDRISGKKSYRVKDLDQLVSELMCYKYRIYCKDWNIIPSIFYYLLPSTMHRVEKKNWWHKLNRYLEDFIEIQEIDQSIKASILRPCGLLEYSLHIWRVYGHDVKELDHDFYSDLEIDYSKIIELRNLLDHEKINWQEQFVTKITKQMSNYRFNPAKAKKQPILSVGMLKRLEEFEEEEGTEEDLIKKLDDYIESMEPESRKSELNVEEAIQMKEDDGIEINVAEVEGEKNVPSKNEHNDDESQSPSKNGTKRKEEEEDQSLNEIYLPFE